MNKLTTCILGLAAVSLIGCVPDESNSTPGFMANNVPSNNSGTNNVDGTNNGKTNNGGTNNDGTNNEGTNNDGTNNGGTNNGGTNNFDPTTRDVPIPAWVGGKTVDGRPIVVEHFGDSGPVLFVLSAIHGTERLALTYGERFRTELVAGFAQRHGIQVTFMQSGNPDGVSRYERYNTNGIDLNRNFDSDNFQPGSTGGDVALSEPEARAIKGAVDASGLTAAISLHCCDPIIDHDGPSLELATEMSLAMANPYRFPEGKLGASNGSLGSYVGLDLGRPIITVEFARTENMPALPQLAEMDKAFDVAGTWTSENPHGAMVDYAAFPQLDEYAYQARFVGTSSGGVPLRVEYVGPQQAGSRPNVVLSGFDGQHRRGTWIAEHTRRELVAFPMLDAAWRIHTVVHPDAVADGSVDPTVVRSAIADGDASVPEAAAVLASLDSASRIFLIENAVGDEDCVTVTGDGTDQLRSAVPQRFDCDPTTDDGLADALANAGCPHRRRHRDRRGSTFGRRNRHHLRHYAAQPRRLQRPDSGAQPRGVAGGAPRFREGRAGWSRPIRHRPRRRSARWCASTIRARRSSRSTSRSRR